MRNKFTMRKSEQKAKKKVSENLDLIEIQLDREKVEAATKMLPPVPKKIKIKKEPQEKVRPNKCNEMLLKFLGWIIQNV